MASDSLLGSVGVVVTGGAPTGPTSSRPDTFSIEASRHVVTIRLTGRSHMLLNNEWLSSRESSPTPDSGTSSDLDTRTPPPPPPEDSDSLSEAGYSSDNKSDPGSKLFFYNFHLAENRFEEEPAADGPGNEEEDSFAGHKYVGEGDAPACRTIRSSKGTVRGVKNRVRAGIATFLHINNNRTWQEREAGKVVVYTTTMGIVRETAGRCQKVRHILRTHLVKYVEKDCFMSREVQAELRERTPCLTLTLPLVFIDGHYLGDADTVEKLNESGELRRILKPYKSPEACSTCQVCGGYRVLPCGVCNGSKKSVHRNHFTTQLVALKCMNCDEVGLVKCFNC